MLKLSARTTLSFRIYLCSFKHPSLTTFQTHLEDSAKCPTFKPCSTVARAHLGSTISKQRTSSRCPNLIDTKRWASSNTTKHHAITRMTTTETLDLMIRGHLKIKVKFKCYKVQSTRRRNFKISRGAKKVSLIARLSSPRQRWTNRTNTPSINRGQGWLASKATTQRSRMPPKLC